MITIERAKQLMKEERPVVFNGKTMKIVNLIFSYNKNGDVTLSLELLERNRERLVRVPVDFVTESDDFKYLDAPGYVNLKNIKTNALKTAAELFSDLDKAKLAESQKTLHKFMRILIDLENELTRLNKKFEK